MVRWPGGGGERQPESAGVTTEALVSFRKGRRLNLFQKDKSLKIQVSCESAVRLLSAAERLLEGGGGSSVTKVTGKSGENRALPHLCTCPGSDLPDGLSHFLRKVGSGI